MIGLKVYDKMEMMLPDVGLLQFRDPENGEIRWVDTSNPVIRTNYQQHFFNHSEACKSFFRKAGADLLHIRTDEDYVKILQKFFLHRK